MSNYPPYSTGSDQWRWFSEANADARERAERNKRHNDSYPRLPPEPERPPRAPEYLRPPPEEME